MTIPILAKAVQYSGKKHMLFAQKKFNQSIFLKLSLLSELKTDASGNVVVKLKRFKEIEIKDLLNSYEFGLLYHVMFDLCHLNHYQTQTFFALICNYKNINGLINVKYMPLVSDPDPLLHLPKLSLTTLEIAGFLCESQVQALIEGLPLLRTLDLCIPGEEIFDLDFSHLSQLRSLYLQNIVIRSLTSLAHLPHLQSLFLIYRLDQLCSFTPLHQIASLYITILPDRRRDRDDAPNLGAIAKFVCDLSNLKGLRLPFEENWLSKDEIADFIHQYSTHPSPRIQF